MWSRGDRVVVRYLRGGRIAWVLPVTVVEDTEDLNVLFLSAGTPTKQVESVDGSAITSSMPYEHRVGLEWQLGDGNWGPHQTLLITPPGSAHSIRLIWTETWHFRGWYVNLQEPQVRTAVGFDTSDQVLDIWVEPDQSWRWEDEHELEEAVRLGHSSLDEAAAVRAEGERVIAAWPFPTGWEEWRPDPAWPIPRLPDGWDRV